MSKFNRARERYEESRRSPVCLACMMAWGVAAVALIALLWSKGWVI